MSRTFFWIAFLASLLMGSLLVASVPHEPVPLLFVALVCGAAVALAWSRWISPDVSWFKRAAAGVGVVIVAYTVYGWLFTNDAFMVDSKCDNRTGTFWPLIFLWLAGAVLFAYALLGRITTIKSLMQSRARAILLMLIVLAWTVVCFVVLARNISMDVFIESMRRAGYIVGGVALGIGGIVAIGWLMSIPHRRRIDQANEDFKGIDASTRADMLDLIDSHSRQGEFLLMYRSAEQAGGMATGPRIGGDPVALPNEAWPMCEDGKPGTFLLQLPLVAPRLPSQWQGRMMVVFLVDYALQMRSYSHADILQLITLQNPHGESVVVRQDLQELAMPYVPESRGDEDDEDEYGGFDTAQLLERIPELGSRLTPLTKYPLLVLNQIMGEAAQFEAEDAILVGGDPRLIQGEHDPLCPICQQPMRFLFQFGDVTEDFMMGDCGVGYVYGCDAHPEQCEGFIDCF